MTSINPNASVPPLPALVAPDSPVEVPAPQAEARIVRRDTASISSEAQALLAAEQGQAPAPDD